MCLLYRTLQHESLLHQQTPRVWRDQCDTHHECKSLLIQVRLRPFCKISHLRCVQVTFHCMVSWRPLSKISQARRPGSGKPSHLVISTTRTPGIGFIAAILMTNACVCPPPIKTSKSRRLRMHLCCNVWLSSLDQSLQRRGIFGIHHHFPHNLLRAFAHTYEEKVSHTESMCLHRLTRINVRNPGFKFLNPSP